MNPDEEQRPDAADDDSEYEPWQHSELLRELHVLHTLPDPQRRGYMLEALLERAFRQAHFEADHNPKMDPERQTDFAVISHSHRYLVEVKWKNREAGTPEVDEVRSRLLGGDSTVVGVLFTMLGINDDGKQRIIGRRDHGLVLVFDEADILVALRDPHELARLLRHKHDQLAVHGQVDVGAQHREARRSPRSRAGKEQRLPETHHRLLNIDGEEVPSFHGAGDFGTTVFCLELPDVDWVPAAGSGMCLDMPVAARSQDEFLGRLDDLNELGWITDRGQWAIQQHGRNWHGVGARSFVQALKDWEARTAALDDPHHSEEFVYFEACDGGFYTVSGSFSAEPTRRLARCNASFQLVGVPVDPGSLQQLYRRFDVPSRGYFRPLVEQSVTRHRLAGSVQLKVLGYIVEPADHYWDKQEWVVGVLAANPYYKTGLQPPDNWPDDLARSGVIICSLRSHHPLSKPKERYELWSYEVARTSDAHALRVVAEWSEVEEEREERMPTAGAASRYFSVGVGEVLKEENPAPGRAMPNLQ
ncbi:MULTISPECIES: hypothetical protein [unclassified Streptomyces]|uniref:hypothetical protein n=1 Tax=unclassified Streptomyces TaxID=2593676 RepID=UPI002E299FE3|nr:hypothetical protein [Streptomyces sp. NBC_00223]